jgi:hypothetical protein
MKKRNIIGWGIVVLVLIAVFLNQIVNFTINVKWFSEVGYLSIYFTKVMQLYGFIIKALKKVLLGGRL